jgi:hypothetical protein
MNTTRNGVGYLDCVRDEEEAAQLGDLVSRFGNLHELKAPLPLHHIPAVED